MSTLPYGVFVPAEGGPPRCGVRTDDGIVDLASIESAGLLGTDHQWFARPSLNAFMAAGRAAWLDVRGRLNDLLAGDVPRHALDGVRMLLPFEVADYVDFYSSLDHAANVGRILRPDGEPLAPNWRHLPVGYHGRAGTIAVSGTPVVRPCGLRPDYGPTQRLDFEAEVGFVVGVGSELGTPVPTSAFADHVFGVVLVNDWSARDIQAFETRPLGPFLGKSFLTSISPWVVPLDALHDLRISGPPQEPPPADHLRDVEPWGLDLTLEVQLNGAAISRPPFAGMYWTPSQQLAHLTANGASLRTGDLFASGTVSGPERDQRGCLLELTWGGTEPLHLPDGTRRTFLEDGDTVTISAPALGEVTGTVVNGTG